MAEMNDISPESGSNLNHKDNALTQDDDDSSDVKPNSLDIQGAEGGSTVARDDKQHEDKESLMNSDNNSNNNNNNINNDNNSTNNNNNIDSVSEIKTLVEDTQSDEIRAEEEDDELSYLYDTIGNNNNKSKNDKSGKKSPLFQDDDWENRVKQLREEISETEQQHTIWQNNFSARRDGAVERWKEIKRKKQHQIQKIHKLKNLVNGNAEEEDTDSTEGMVTDQTKVE